MRRETLGRERPIANAPCPFGLRCANRAADRLIILVPEQPVLLGSLMALARASDPHRRALDVPRRPPLAGSSFKPFAPNLMRIVRARLRDAILRNSRPHAVACTEAKAAVDPRGARATSSTTRK